MTTRNTFIWTKRSGDELFVRRGVLWHDDFAQAVERNRTISLFSTTQFAIPIRLFTATKVG